MKITLRDNVREYDQPMSIFEIAQDISEGLARVACVGKINGEVADLRTIVDQDAEVEILTFDAQEGKDAFRHTAASTPIPSWPSAPPSKKASTTTLTAIIPSPWMNWPPSKPR